MHSGSGWHGSQYHVQTDVHVCTSANRVCVRHDSRDLPGHRRGRPNAAAVVGFHGSSEAAGGGELSLGQAIESR